VAVDVRVTRTHLAVTDLVGREISPVDSFPTDLDPRDFVEHLAHEVRRLLAENPGAGRCQGVGVAFPGMLDRSGDVVVHAPALGWRDVALREPLATSLGLPVVMENAVKAWALAQVWALRGEPRLGDMVFVNVSDGVGVGVVIGGEVLRGRHNVAGEFGHLPLSVDGPRCACGAAGCWEAYVSNLATLARYVGRPVEPGQPVPAEVARLTVEDVVARARGGDARALAALLATAHYLGLGLASIVNALDPARLHRGDLGVGPRRAYGAGRARPAHPRGGGGRRQHRRGGGAGAPPPARRGGSRGRPDPRRAADRLGPASALEEERPELAPVPHRAFGPPDVQASRLDGAGHGGRQLHGQWPLRLRGERAVDEAEVRQERGVRLPVESPGDRRVGGTERPVHHRSREQASEVLVVALDATQAHQERWETGSDGGSRPEHGVLRAGKARKQGDVGR
jgi:predicted NBD/HSP70 family sugar kinase